MPVSGELYVTLKIFYCCRFKPGTDFRQPDVIFLSEGTAHTHFNNSLFSQMKLCWGATSGFWRKANTIYSNPWCDLQKHQRRWNILTRRIPTGCVYIGKGFLNGSFKAIREAFIWYHPNSPNVYISKWKPFFFSLEHFHEKKCLGCWRQRQYFPLNSWDGKIFRKCYTHCDENISIW